MCHSVDVRPGVCDVVQDPCGSHDLDLDMCEVGQLSCDSVVLVWGCVVPGGDLVIL